MARLFEFALYCKLENSSVNGFGKYVANEALYTILAGEVTTTTRLHLTAVTYLKVIESTTCTRNLVYSKTECRFIEKTMPLTSMTQVLPYLYHGRP